MADRLAPIKLTDKQMEHVKMRSKDFMGQATYIRSYDEPSSNYSVAYISSKEKAEEVCKLLAKRGVK